MNPHVFEKGDKIAKEPNAQKEAKQAHDGLGRRIARVGIANFRAQRNVSMTSKIARR